MVQSCFAISREKISAGFWSGSLTKLELVHIYIDLILPLKRSLARDNKHTDEKEQVFLIVRTLLDIASERKHSNTVNSAHPTKEDGAHRHGRTSSLANGLFSPTYDSNRASPLRENIMRALVSVAEHEEDANVLRLPAIEIIAETCERISLYLGLISS